MKSTQTGIAVALALVVISVFFIFPGLSPFRNIGASSNTASSATTHKSTSNTMTTENSNQLQVTDETLGKGATAQKGDTVTVNYVGSLTDGKVFDASANHQNTKNGFTFTLGAGQVIKGWDEGIAGMKEGGKRKLVIPASLAYGNRAIGNVIPANSTLIFEVELLKVQKSTK